MDKTKRTINVIGKVCRIIATVLLVFSFIGAGAMVTAGIVLAVLPEDVVNVDMASESEFKLSGKLIQKIPDDAIVSVDDGLDTGRRFITINGISIDGVERDADGSIIMRGRVANIFFSLRRAGFALIIYSISTGCVIYMMIMLKKFMLALEKCGSPFEDGVVKAMTNFAISLIPYAVLKPVITSLANSVLMTNSFNVSYNLDLTTIFAALVIILLILIFKYGVKLQQQADETL